MIDDDRDLVHRNRSGESRPIQMLDKHGNLIREFPDMVTAHRETGVYISGISNCCTGISKTAGGYRWRKVN